MSFVISAVWHACGWHGAGRAGGAHSVMLLKSLSTRSRRKRRSAEAIEPPNGMKHAASTCSERLRTTPPVYLYLPGGSELL